MFCEVCKSMLGSSALVQMIDTGFQQMGYTLIDNQDNDIGGSNEYADGYRVYKLTPSSPNQPATYIKIRYGSGGPDPNYVYFDYSLSYDVATHSSPTGFTNGSSTVYSRLYTSSASGYFAYAYIFEQKFYFITYVGGTWSRVAGGYIDSPFKPHMRVVNAATIGTDVWVDVDNVVGVEKGMELLIWWDETDPKAVVKVAVKDFDVANNKIQIEDLTVDVDSHNLIGMWCYGFSYFETRYNRWRTLYSHNCTPTPQGISYTDIDTPVLADTNSYDAFSQKSVLRQRIFIRENRPLQFLGYWTKDILSCSGFSIEDVLYINKRYEGTATSASSSALDDNSQSWAVDELVNKVVIITAGTGYGQTRVISGNTATGLTTSRPWEQTPDVTSTYIIVDEVYRNFWDLAVREIVE